MTQQATDLIAASSNANEKPSILSLRQSIVKVSDLFFEPGQVTELRALDAVTDQDPRPHTVSGFFNDPEALLEAVAKLVPVPKGTEMFVKPLVSNPACHQG